MAEKKYYTIEEAASFLGITPAEVNLRRERNELRGLRDGPNWKFKAEDVESLARRLRSQEISAAADDDTGEVLLSELALGGSDAGKAGTVIGGKGKPTADSDLRLADSDVKLAGSGVKKTGSGVKKPGSGVGAVAPPTAQDLELTIDENLLVDDDVVPEPKKPASGSGKKTGSAIGQKPGSGVGRKPGDSGIGDRTVQQDDDLVLATSTGSGSDVTIGGDSGISLVDPTDSGLSLEEPLELDREADDDSLELGEDDMLTFSEEPEAATADKADEGFQLTPMEDTGEEDSESGSQVIALETPAVSDAAPTMIAGGGAPVAAAMLDEDLAGMGEPVGLGPAVPAAGSPLGITPVFADQAAVAVGPAMVVPEAPYTGLQITSLAICIILLILCGWMGYDLLRNMWSWNGAYTVNSSLMDFIVGLFG
jgi:hypothetical protein